MKSTSVPCQLPISESFRLLVYLKTEYKAGFIHKCDIGNVGRKYGKDPRTLAKLLGELVSAKFIGENSRTYFLRKYKFLTSRLAIGCRAFKCSVDEIKNRSVFEAKQLSATADFLNRYFRRKRAVKSAINGRCTNQIEIPLPTGLLSTALSISTGKVAKIKRIAVSEGFLKVNKTFTALAPGSVYAASILQDQFPGTFSRDGVLVRRAADTLGSFVLTFRIKNRRTIKAHKYGKQRHTV